MATRSILIASILTLCACGLTLAFRAEPQGPATPSGYPLKHPGEVQTRWDILGCYRASMPDGSDEVICFNGVRRPLLARRSFITTRQVPEGLKCAESVRALPPGVFPVVVTANESGQVLVFSVQTGEIFQTSASSSCPD